MTSSQIRQSFLDFFKSKQHTIVPSSSLMPDSPNLLFTNAGMNQFVPIFLGQTKCPYSPGRAADTQKCIRAGGKHNDLEDVGLDTYHHTFFEMLGNWSFGDYFKKEAIEWAWELVVEKWKFPATRLYATVFCPDMNLWQDSLTAAVEFARIRLAGGSAGGLGDETTGGGKGSEAINFPDEEAAAYWAEYYLKAGLDPYLHIIPGNRKDNFWMMGETGPCGPCSELHVDLTPAGDTRGSLVNKGDARCIEIWNLVFIQFNANPDGTFSPLPAKHVDTGMGFERVTSIIQGTKGLTDFANARISNYETDIFRPIFDAIEKLSGKRYGSTLPKPSSTGDTEQEKADIAFRVIADHIRTLSFAIADGIQPGNNDRNYVLRRILRRAVRYGRTLGFHEPFFYKLVDVLAGTMGDVFPEIRTRKTVVQDVIRTEEEAFNKTLDSGIEIFELVLKRRNELRTEADKIAKLVGRLRSRFGPISSEQGALKSFVEANASDITMLVGFTIDVSHQDFLKFFGREVLDMQGAAKQLRRASPTVAEYAFGDDNPGRKNFNESLDRLELALSAISAQVCQFPGRAGFVLYDTYGFPLDLTELMARERGLTVDKAGFEKLMEEQRARARAAQKKETISLVESFDVRTAFVGYDKLESECQVLSVFQDPKLQTFVVVDVSPLYAEMGGQVGDQGTLLLEGERKPLKVLDTLKRDQAFLLKLDVVPDEPLAIAIPYSKGFLQADKSRRDAIQRHHTVTHLLHWALHEVVSQEASQKGSFVGPDKLTFDFNSAPLTPAQVADIEKLVNERIVENAGVSWTEVPYTDMKSRKDVMQFFGDKYGDAVRVVQIGGHAQKLDGYSMELCGGTHTRATGEIGLFRIVGENAIAAGVRRIEAIAGLEAYQLANDQLRLLRSVAGHLNSPVAELEKKIETLLEQQKALEKQVKTAMQRNASNAASELLTLVTTVNGIPLITHNLGEGDGDYFQAVADALKGRFKGVVVLGGGSAESVALVTTVSPEFTKQVQAGKIIQQIAPIVGGKGGGKPDNARGGGKDANKLDEALAKVRSLI